MNVTFDVGSNCRLSADVEDMKQAFEFIAYAESVFGVDCCENCQSKNLRLDHRRPKGYDYYSVQCKDCHYELKLSTTKEDGRLYTKEWEPPYSDDGDGGNHGDGGKSSQGESESQEPARASSRPF